MKNFLLKLLCIPLSFPDGIKFKKQASDLRFTVSSEEKRPRGRIAKKKYTEEDIATIVKHRDNMLELEKTEYGEKRELIQIEIYHCRRFINNAHKNRINAIKRSEKNRLRNV